MNAQKKKPISASVTRRQLVCGAGAIWLGAGLAGFGLCSRAEARGDGDARQKRRWRVMVVVQETHISHPKIPDPAVETELNRQLIEAGYKVIDPSRFKDVRYDAVVSRIIKGGPSALADAVRLGRRFGADILVSGEAFTQVDHQEQVNSELGPRTAIQCRCRVELKAVRVETAEMIWADGLHKTGSAEPTEELSSKKALQETASDIAEKLLPKIDKLSQGLTQSVEIDVRGIGSATRGGDLEEALGKVPGILDVTPGDLDGDTYHLEMEIDKKLVKGLGKLLETDARLKPFGLKVKSANGSKVVADAAATPVKAAGVKPKTK